MVINNSSSDSSPFTLTYFNTHGRCLQIRLLFHLTDTTFNDRRISRAEDWPRMKPNTPWGHLPVLEHGDVTVWNTCAIVRYVAGQVRMWPVTELDQARSIALINSVDDVMAQLGRFARVRNPIKFAWMARALMKTVLPSICDKFQSQITGDYVLGDEMSAVDLSVFSLFSIILGRAGDRGARRIVEARPGLHAFVERMHGNPRIAAYLEATPDAVVR